MVFTKSVRSRAETGFGWISYNPIRGANRLGCQNVSWVCVHWPVRLLDDLVDKSLESDGVSVLVVVKLGVTNQVWLISHDSLKVSQSVGVSWGFPLQGLELRSYQCPTDSCWNLVILVESGGMQIGRGLCQYCHSCCFSFYQNVPWNSGNPVYENMPGNTNSHRTNMTWIYLK